MVMNIYTWLIFQLSEQNFTYMYCILNEYEQRITHDYAEKLLELHTSFMHFWNMATNTLYRVIRLLKNCNRDWNIVKQDHIFTMMLTYFFLMNDVGWCLRNISWINILQKYEVHTNTIRSIPIVIGTAHIKSHSYIQSHNKLSQWKEFHFSKIWFQNKKW